MKSYEGALALLKNNNNNNFDALFSVNDGKQQGVAVCLLGALVSLKILSQKYLH